MKLYPIQVAPEVAYSAGADRYRHLIASLELMVRLTTPEALGLVSLLSITTCSWDPSTNP